MFDTQSVGNQCVQKRIVAVILVCDKNKSTCNPRDLELILIYGDILYTSAKKQHNKILLTDIPN